MTCETLEALYAMAVEKRGAMWAQRNPEGYRQRLDAAFADYRKPNPGEFAARMQEVTEWCAMQDGLPPYAAWCGARTTTGRAAA